MRFAVISLTLLLTVTACGSVGTEQSLGGSAVLSWDPVTMDTSGNTLQDLAGYQIHYGTSAEAMNIVEMLTDPNQTTYTVKHLSPGTWYFAVNAYTTGGTYSGPSNVASKTIN